jgi:hypothetical protein
MKNYSLEKFKEILSEDVINKTNKIKKQFAKYAPTLIPFSFVRDRVFLYDMKESKSYLCSYVLNENSIVLDNIEKVSINDNYLQAPLKKIFEALENNGDPYEHKQELLDAIRNKVAFTKSLETVKANVHASVVANSLVNRKKISNKLMEAIKHKWEKLTKLQKMSIDNANSLLFVPYKLQEGKSVEISLAPVASINFKDKFTWNVRKARKSIVEKKAQVPLIEKILNSAVDKKEDIIESAKLFVDNLVFPWVITRADITKGLDKVAKSKLIKISNESIEKVSDKIYAILVEKEKSNIQKFLKHIYEDLDGIKRAEVYNAVSVARKVQLLEDAGRNVDVDAAAKEAENNGDTEEIVDSDVEDATSENSSEDYEYTADDIEEYISLLKNMLKEINFEKYKEIFGEEEGEEEATEEPIEEPTEEVPEGSETKEGEDLFDEEPVQEAKIIKKIFENIDDEDVIAYEENEPMDTEDDTEDILSDTDEEETVETDTQKIVDMIHDLEAMKEEDQIDGERVSEIAKFVYEYMENQKEDTETEENEEEMGEETTEAPEETEEAEEPAPVAESKKKLNESPIHPDESDEYGARIIKIAKGSPGEDLELILDAFGYDGQEIPRDEHEMYDLIVSAVEESDAETLKSVLDQLEGRDPSVADTDEVNEENDEVFGELDGKEENNL